MMKGYLTLYLSLTLTALLGFILLLIGGALRNQSRLQLECACDISMNSVLAEFSTELLNQYELLYVDASYEGGPPELPKVEQHLNWYFIQNLTSRERISSGTISQYTVASDDQGAPLRKQIAVYMQQEGKSDQDSDIRNLSQRYCTLQNRDTIAEWGALQELIMGKERPWYINAKGIKEQVELENPADAVYARCGENLLESVYSIGVGAVDTMSLSSHRILNQGVNPDHYVLSEEEENLVRSYLFDKYGYYGHQKENCCLDLQIEYVIAGQATDYENLQQVVNSLFAYFFAGNAEVALSDEGLKGEADEVAQNLLIVQYDETFKDPLVQSMLYACAYLESVKDIYTLLQGGNVPAQKGSMDFSARIRDVMANTVPGEIGKEGLSYQKYLALLVQNQERSLFSLRMMDVMEMDVRYRSGNQNFQMDWCIQNYTAQLSVQDHFGSNYHFLRKYGYY